MKGETAIALASVIATGLVGLASIKVAYDNQSDSLRAEVVRADKTELRRVLDSIVTDLAHALDVGTNPESNLPLAQRATTLTRIRSTIVYANPAHLNIRLGAEKRALGHYAGAANAFDAVWRLTRMRLSRSTTASQLITARHRFLRAYQAFEHDARRLAESQVR